MTRTADCEVLAVGAHPDDVELTVGGTLLLAKARGLRTAVCHLTMGEMGTRGNPEQRRREAEEAAQVLRADALEFLGLPDGHVAATDEARHRVIRVLREYRPRVVLAPHTEDLHPDHENAGRLVAAFLEHRRGYTVFLVALHAALVAAGFAHDPHLGSVVAAMLAVNAVYSLRAKGLPLLDVAVVALWGGLFTALSGASFAICALVGLLTLVMHVFQMDVDREVDAANRVRTSVVASGRTPALVAGACALLAAGLFAQLGPLWAASAAVPLLAERLLRTTEAAWMLSRIYAGVVLLAAIGTSHAGS